MQILNFLPPNRGQGVQICKNPRKVRKVKICWKSRNFERQRERARISLSCSFSLFWKHCRKHVKVTINWQISENFLKIENSKSLIFRNPKLLCWKHCNPFTLFKQNIGHKIYSYLFLVKVEIISSAQLNMARTRLYYFPLVSFWFSSPHPQSLYSRCCRAQDTPVVGERFKKLPSFKYQKCISLNSLLPDF